MKYLKILFIFVFAFGFSQKQKSTLPTKTQTSVGYEISVQTKNLVGKILYWSFYKGNYKTTIKKDSATVKKEGEIIKFVEKNKIVPLIIQISVKGNDSKFDLAVENGSKISVILNDDSFNSVTTSDKMNSDFFKYQKSQNTLEKETLLNGFRTNYPNSALGIFSEIELRKNNRAKFSADDKGRNDFLKDINLSDKRLPLLPNFYSFLNSYITILPINNENYLKGVDKILEGQNCNSNNYFFYISWIFKNIEFYEKKNLSKTYDNTFNKYLNDTVCINRNPTLYQRVLDQRSKFEKTPIGSIFPDFEVIGLDGKISKISDFYKGKASFILFYDPDCEHCKTEVPKIATYFKELETKTGRSIQKIAFFNGFDISKWKSFTEENGLKNWINIKNTDNSKDYKSDLGVYANPSYILLDKNGAIVTNQNNKTDIEKQIIAE